MDYYPVKPFFFHVVKLSRFQEAKAAVFFKTFICDPKVPFPRRNEDLLIYTVCKQWLNSFLRTSEIHPVKESPHARESGMFSINQGSSLDKRDPRSRCCWVSPSSMWGMWGDLPGLKGWEPFIQVTQQFTPLLLASSWGMCPHQTYWLKEMQAA